MRRKITDTPKDDVAALPDLTAQQQKFVEGLLAGKSASDAYRAAYDCRNCQDSTVWAEASRLRANHNVAAWLSAARQAHFGADTVTFAGHIRELDRLKEIAINSGNVGAAVQAEQLRGKAAGLYVEKLDVTTHSDPALLLDEIASLSPELAQKLAQQSGLDRTEH